MSWTDDEKWLSFTLGSQDSGVLESIEGLQGIIYNLLARVYAEGISLSIRTSMMIYKKESKRRATKYCSWTTSVTRSRQISGKHISLSPFHRWLRQLRSGYSECSFVSLCTGFT
ncbi:hypothetical protein CEXT_395081 [Caerostris extrusa]|uniref:Uncharacterized protein n=1 Tax=Caerostris extrusa TaxID=172846 RepID=A0AAV4P2X2_CAEEX|nr:hypothetical protein CEXT_395081 [Caerostris extrusa]